MPDPALLQLLCCPETHQSLRLASAGFLRQLNRKISEGGVRNKAGRLLTEAATGGLIREDGKVLYPIRNDIPVMLIEEAVALDEAGLPPDSST